MKKILYKLCRRFLRIVSRIGQLCLMIRFKLSGPPRILNYSQEFNLKILRTFGAQIGQRAIRIHSPITIHEGENGYHNLIIKDECILNGNNFLDLSEKIILEKGVSLGPGVIIMTHNWYNRNEYLVDVLRHTCGKEPVWIKEGSGIKAGAVIVKGVTIGCNAVVAANAVVNRDVQDYCMVAGVPAKVIKTFVPAQK